MEGLPSPQPNQLGAVKRCSSRGRRMKDDGERHRRVSKD